MMKRLPQPLSRELSPVVVYRDDVEAIDRALRDIATRIEIRTSAHAFETVDELFTHHSSDALVGLEIVGYDPQVSVTFGKAACTIYVADETLPLRGLLNQIEEILRARQTWLPKGDGLIWLASVVASVFLFRAGGSVADGAFLELPC